MISPSANVARVALPQASRNTANTVPQGSVTFLLSSVGRANISLCTHELVWETHKFGTDFCAVPPHSSLAQSVERVTVNHDVVGSSPTGGAIFVVRKSYKT